MILSNEIKCSLDNLFAEREVTTLSRQRVKHELQRLVEMVESLERDRFFMELKSTTEVAEIYGTSRQAINTRAARIRRQLGQFGYKAEGWLFTAAEVQALEPGPDGRPRKEADDDQD